MRRKLTLDYSYEGDEASTKPEIPEAPNPVVSGQTPAGAVPQATTTSPDQAVKADLDDESHVYGENIYGEESAGTTNEQYEPPKPVVNEHGFAGTVGIKEDG